MQRDVVMRVMGTVAMVTGYFILLYLDVKTGVAVRFLANMLMLPYAIRIKLWDIVALESFFAILDITKFIQLSV
jgi:hypothetical protein